MEPPKKVPRLENGNESRKFMVTRVCPWKSRDEFLEVYYNLFDTDGDLTKAYRWLTIWTLRRVNLTPASILSTKTIVGIMIKDREEDVSPDKTMELKMMYSLGVTRFLNYMNSINYNKVSPSMYKTAKQLGIETFLVDLRHLCSHGHTLPSLTMFRRTIQYCLKWLKSFYWDQEKSSIEDITIKNVQLKYDLELQEKLDMLFEIYDIATEAHCRNCTDYEEAKLVLEKVRYNKLKQYCEETESQTLISMRNSILRQVTNNVKGVSQQINGATYYCAALCKCEFFFKAIDYRKANNNKIENNIIDAYQNLFRNAASLGFMENIFFTLLSLADNPTSSQEIRIGSGFWAEQIIVGYQLYQKFKVLYKIKKNANMQIKVDLDMINEDKTNKHIESIYEELKISSKTHLLFTTALNHPWQIKFHRDYIKWKMLKVNIYTKNILIKCLQLIVPPLPDNELTELMELINLICPDDDMQSESNGIIDSEQFESPEKQTVETNRSQSVWTMASNDLDWDRVSIGRIPQ